MSFTQTFVILFAALAAAHPSDWKSDSVVPASSSNDVSSSNGDSGATVCGNGQVQSCCDSGDQDLLGLNCLQVPVIAVPLNNYCGNNIAACCPSDQSSGAIVVTANCNPIPISL